MFTLEYYTASIATGESTMAQLTAQYNGVLHKLNNGFQTPSALPYVHSVFGLGAHLCRLRLQSPRFLPFPYPDLAPQNRGSAFESPVRSFDFSYNPFPLNGTDEIDIYASQNSGSSETEYAALQFTDNVRIPVPTGQTFTVHSTASTTLTAGSFTLVQPTFDYALPAGMYSLVGCRAFSATAVYFQMQPVMQPLWRPGGAGVQAYDQLDPIGQRLFSYGGVNVWNWGVWLSFRQNTPPGVNHFATSADTAEEYWYDLVYTGP